MCVVQAWFGRSQIDSLFPIKILLGQRFGAMKMKGQSVKLGVPATEVQCQSSFHIRTFIDPSLERDKLRMVWKKHCHASHYVYQLKRFIDEDCY